MCVRLHGLDRARTVADPFMGLGSTAVACVSLGVDFVGIELDEGYLMEAVDRVRTLLDRPAKKVARA
jgi:site-specific DNA-methyltransferase (adenine-specific)